MSTTFQVVNTDTHKADFDNKNPGRKQEVNCPGVVLVLQTKIPQRSRSELKSETQE